MAAGAAGIVAFGAVVVVGEGIAAATSSVALTISVANLSGSNTASQGQTLGVGWGNTVMVTGCLQETSQSVSIQIYDDNGWVAGPGGTAGAGDASTALVLFRQPPRMVVVRQRRLLREVRWQQQLHRTDLGHRLRVDGVQPVVGCGPGRDVQLRPGSELGDLRELRGQLDRILVLGFASLRRRLDRRWVQRDGGPSRELRRHGLRDGVRVERHERGDQRRLRIDGQRRRPFVDERAERADGHGRAEADGATPSRRVADLLRRSASLLDRCLPVCR